MSLEEWSKIPINTLLNLVEILPRRVEAVIPAVLAKRILSAIQRTLVKVSWRAAAACELVPESLLHVAHRVEVFFFCSAAQTSQL